MLPGVPMPGKILLLLLVCGVMIASRLRWSRKLSAERRLVAVAALAAIPLLILRVTEARLGSAIALAADPPLLLSILGFVAAVAAAAALTLIWSAILDDAGRSIARITLLALILAFLLLSLSSVAAWSYVALIVALRTGWLRVSPKRTLLATVAALFALAMALNWPSLPMLPACWPPGCHHGIPLLRSGRSFLILHLAIVSLRLVFRLIFGPRRIGRRLLVSHMMAGAVPVALISLFLVLVSLLALAHFRASLGQRLLQNHHAISQTILANLAPDLRIDEIPPEREAEQFAAIATQLGGRWPASATWTPRDALHTPQGHGCGRVYVAVSAIGGPRPRSLTAEIAGDSARAVGWIYSDGDSQRTQGDVTRLRQLPDPQGWMRRPTAGSQLGIIKSAGCSFHVTDQTLPTPAGKLRLQVIEALPFGRVSVLEELIGPVVWLEERMRFTCYSPPATEQAPPAGASATGGIAEGQIHLLQTDTLAVAPSDARPATSYRSSYVLLPAQEWFPAGSHLSSPAAGMIADPQWAEIRLPILGIADIRDLIPPLPALRENPLSALPIVVLLATALLFVAVEATAFVSALRIGRSIAHSVAVLRAGTERLQTGDLSYRITMAGQDELTALGAAFNEMAVGLEAGRQAALEQERLAGELEVARRIQQRLLPEKPPAIEGWQIAGVSVPARQVGGDYYDLIPLAADRLLLVLADVSGKGVPAALLMSSVRASLHTMITGREELRDIMVRLNRFIHASTADTEFVTLVLGFLNAGNGKLDYSLAGHDPPYLVRRDGQIERLTAGGLILGAFPQAEYRKGQAVLRPGDLLFTYTDGLSEALNHREEMFGDERIAAVLREHRGDTPDALLELILERLGTFTGDADPSDDITLLAIRRALG